MALAGKRGANRPYTVLVEGNIGCGKTTFLEYFKKYENVCVLAEPVDLWRNCNGHNLLVSVTSILTLKFYSWLKPIRVTCTRTRRSGVSVSSRMCS